MRLKPILLVVGLCAAFALGRYGFRHDPPATAVAVPTIAAKPISTHPHSAPLLNWLAELQTNAAGEPSDARTNDDVDPVASYEDLIYAQPDLIDASLKSLRQQTQGKIDLYALGFAGDAAEPPFRNEVDYLSKLLAQRFGADGRTVQLINSPQTFERTPLATRTNLYEALAGIAAKMDLDEDILLLFLTSHGSREHELYVEMGAMPLDQLTPADIRDALDTAKIRWRVIVVSACYSGGFIPALREPHTLIITAARSDRTSFGCGSDSQITWFGRAFLTEALNQTTDFHDAFLRARQTIAGWEKREKETPSEPQYWAGPLIQQKLDAWRATLASAPPVPFAPAAIARAASASGSRRSTQ
jgi:hypothetical protein